MTLPRLHSPRKWWHQVGKQDIEGETCRGEGGAEEDAACAPALGWLTAEEAAAGPREGRQTSGPEARAEWLAPQPAFPPQVPATTPGPSSGSA